MGGTEIDGALDMALRLRCPAKIQQDVLLITDGDIWEWEKIAVRAVTSGHRFFTVGVGSSVSEAFVRTLAERTGGACELVSPNENMAERIHHHFKRIGTSRSNSNEVTWPAQPLRVFPEVLPSIYDGDTTNLFAWFAEPLVGEVQLRISLTDGSQRVLAACIESTGNSDQDTVIPRMAAALKLREISEEKAGQELAVKYQLVSRWTNFLAIVVRAEDEKAHTLPDLHKVEQMLAAGWGGFGSVRGFGAGRGYDLPMFSRSKSKSIVMESASYCLADPADPLTSHDSWMWKQDYQKAMDRFVELLNETLAAGSMPTTINIPHLPVWIAAVLALLVDEGIDEQAVVTLFLNQLANSADGSRLSHQAKRVISKAYKDLHVDSQIKQIILERLKIKPVETGFVEEMYDVPTFIRKSAGYSPRYR